MIERELSYESVKSLIFQLEEKNKRLEQENQRLREALNKSITLIDKANLMECALYRKDITDIRAIAQNKE